MMMTKRACATLLAIAAMSIEASADKRGCRFFLCIQDPAWPSNGECPATVIPILHAMKWGHPPPPCREAGWNGSIGYERYEACPSGQVAGDTLAPVSCWPPGFGTDRQETITFTEAMCVAPPPSTAEIAKFSLSKRWALQSVPHCSYTISARPLRDKPRFMDYTASSGARERVYVKF